MKNPKHLARLIIAKHTELLMRSVEFCPKNNRELRDEMMENCAFILAEKFLNGELTPMEYNDTRNELSGMLLKRFESYVDETSMATKDTMYDRIKRMAPEEMRRFVYWVYMCGNKDGTNDCCDGLFGFFGGAMLCMDSTDLMPNDRIDDLWDRFDKTYSVKED